MNKKRLLSLYTLFSFAATGATINVGFTKLTGATGGSPAETAVYVADLSGVTFPISSVTIQDNSAGLGGSGGQFSGFDLDAIVFSRTLTVSAAGAAALTGLNVFDFSTAGIVFASGVQRTPADPALFGTSAGKINNAVATLGVFDGNSTTNTDHSISPFASGFVSLGDGGSASFNLTSAIASSGPLYLYIGEVGDNGEVAAGTITVSSTPVTGTPEPSTFILLGTALIWLSCKPAALLRCLTKFR